MKGTIREIRKDSQFIARQKLHDQIQKYEILSALKIYLTVLYLYLCWCIYLLLGACCHLVGKKKKHPSFVAEMLCHYNGLVY